MKTPSPSGKRLALALAYVLPPKVSADLVDATLSAYEHAQHANPPPPQDGGGK